MDLVREGYDAGVRLSEFVERDMVSVRLTDAFRLIVVGAPDYLDKHGTPERPEDLLQHECLTFRSSTTGELYAWELERGRRTWRVPVRGGLVVNDGLFCTTWAEQGLGLAYVMEPLVKEQLRTGTLRRVLEPYAASVPGFFLFIPVERRAPRRSGFSWRRFAISRRRRWPPARRNRRAEPAPDCQPPLTGPSTRSRLVRRPFRQHDCRRNRGMTP